MSHPAAEAENRNVLIVEDEAVIALELQHRLENIGYGVVGVADTGREAVALWGETRPDVVLMDIKLKGDMDGIEAAREISNLDGAPVVFLSANTDQGTVRRAIDLAPFGFLAKPVQERQLHIALQVALRRHEKERGVQDALSTATSEVATLRSLVSYCAECGRVRGDDGEWYDRDTYIAQRARMGTTRALCPNCSGGVSAE